MTDRIRIGDTVRIDYPGSGYHGSCVVVEQIADVKDIGRCACFDWHGHGHALPFGNGYERLTLTIIKRKENHQ